MTRMIGLNDRSARLVAPPGAPHHLCQQGKSPFLRMVVSTVKGQIRIKHSDQRDIVKIKPFCHHLCAEQDISFAFCKAVEQFFMRSAACGRVCIHTDHADTGQQR